MGFHPPSTTATSGLSFEQGRDGSSPGKNFSTTANKSAPKVLVVDDEALLRWSVAETLGDCGFTVTEARDATSAMVAFLSPEGTDVVLLDLCLPDCNDLGVLTAMHELSPATPVILMTAYGSPELSNEAQARGAFTVVDKPFEMSQLAPLVHRALAARPS